MKPTEFGGSDRETFSDHAGNALPGLMTDKGVAITCWELSEDDLERVKAGGRIFLFVANGAAPMPPVTLSTSGVDVKTVADSVVYAIQKNHKEK